MQLSEFQTFKRGQSEAFLGLGTSAFYDHQRTGVLPSPIKMNGTNASQWLVSELTACKAAMIAGASSDELKTLVANLVAKRQEFKKLAVAA